MTKLKICFVSIGLLFLTGCNSVESPVLNTRTAYDTSLTPDLFLETTLHALTPDEGVFTLLQERKSIPNVDTELRISKKCREDIRKYEPLDMRKNMNCITTEHTRIFTDDNSEYRSVSTGRFEKRDIQGSSYIRYETPERPIREALWGDTIQTISPLTIGQWFKLDETVPREFARGYASRMSDWNIFGVASWDVKPAAVVSQMGDWEMTEDTEESQTWKITLSKFGGKLFWLPVAPLFEAIGSEADNFPTGDLFQNVYNPEGWDGTININKMTSVMVIDMSAFRNNYRAKQSIEHAVHSLYAVISPSEIMINIVTKETDEFKPSTVKYYAKSGYSKVSVEVYEDNTKINDPSYFLVKERSLDNNEGMQIVPPVEATHLGDFLDDGSFYSCHRMAYSDVCSHWAEKLIGHASLAGYAGIWSYEFASLPVGKLLPDSPITVNEFILMLRRAQLENAYISSVFDQTKMEEYNDTIIFLKRMNLLSSDELKWFSASEILTKKQMLVVLSRLLEKIYPNAIDNDIPALSQLDQTAVLNLDMASLYKIGVLNSSNEIDMDATVTRAEAIAMIERVRESKDRLLLK